MPPSKNFRGSTEFRRTSLKSQVLDPIISINLCPIYLRIKKFSATIDQHWHYDP